MPKGKKKKERKMGFSFEKNGCNLANRCTPVYPTFAQNPKSLCVCHFCCEIQEGNERNQTKKEGQNRYRQEQQNNKPSEKKHTIK